MLPLRWAVTGLCVVWWIFEPIPIPATSLVSLAVLPLLGVITEDDVAAAYGNPLVLLLLGGLLLSTALARSGAHRRLALDMVSMTGGTSSRMVVLGFMTASTLISFWISNTATTLVLLPIALAVLHQMSRPQTPTTTAARHCLCRFHRWYGHPDWHSGKPRFHGRLFEHIRKRVLVPRLDACWPTRRTAHDSFRLALADPRPDLQRPVRIATDGRLEFL